MPFLTQGKTNWKLIAIAAVLAAIVGYGFVVLQLFEVTEEPPDLEPPTQKPPTEIQSVEETREAHRRAHIVAINTDIYLAVLDCIEVNHCGTVAEVLARCVDSAWRFDPDGTNCTISIVAPKDPLSGGDYYINPEPKDGYVQIWADSDESKWWCDWNETSNECRGTSYKFER